MRPYEKEQILIIGSGASTHSLHLTEEQALAFISELSKVLTQYDQHEREKALVNWEKVLPHARLNHPREEHLIPLHVIVGAAGSDRGQLLNPNVKYTQASFKFGA